MRPGLHDHRCHRQDHLPQAPSRRLTIQAPPQQGIGVGVVAARSLPRRADALARARWLLPLAALLLGIAFRAPNLAAYDGHYDEGVYLESTLVVAAGHLPFREAFSSQGPLFLVTLLPGYLLTGDAAGPRAIVASFSLLGLVAAFAVGRTLGGFWAGAAGMALLALSPTYLRNARLALAEEPSLALSVLGVALAAAYSRGKGRAWLLGAGACLGFSVAYKPLSLGAVLAVCALALMAPLGRAPTLGRWARAGVDLALAGALAALLVLAAALPFGLDTVVEQLVHFHTAAREAFGNDLLENWNTVSPNLAWEGPAFYALAAIGMLVVLARQPRALPLAIWLAADVVVLAQHAPLYPRHLVMLMPSLALLGGIAVASLGAVALRRHHVAGRAAGGVLLVLAAGYLAFLPQSLAQSAELASTRRAEVRRAEVEVAEYLASITRPTDVVVADHQVLAFWARRQVPPELVDTSLARVLTRSLTGQAAVAAAERDGAVAVLLWTERLDRLPEFVAWVNANFIPLRSYGEGRTLYLRKGYDYRAIYEAGRQAPATAARVEFGGRIMLVGYTLSTTRLQPGESVDLTLYWQGMRRMDVDYHAFTHLVGPDGAMWGQMDRRVGGDSNPTSKWGEGEVWSESYTLHAGPGSPAGEYWIQVGLYDLATMARLPITGGGSGDQTSIGPIAVVAP